MASGEQEEAPAGGSAPGEARLLAWIDRAAHDLRTPLAVIAGMAETLEASWDRLPEADRVRLLASIRAQAARATVLLEEGVALARPGDQR